MMANKVLYHLYDRTTSNDINCVCLKPHLAHAQLVLQLENP